MFVGKQALVKAKEFPDKSFYSVSFNGVSRFFCYGNSEPFNPLSIAACYGRKMLRTSPHPLVINYFKSSSVSYPFRFPVRLFLHAY